MSVTVNENGWHHTMSDSEWFADMRSHMEFAFAPVKPALATMFWWNKHIARALCKHLYQNGEDGPECVRCGHNKFHEGAYQ